MALYYIFTQFVPSLETPLYKNIDIQNLYCIEMQNNIIKNMQVNLWLITVNFGNLRINLLQKNHYWNGWMEAGKGRSFLLEALLWGRGRAVGLRQRHDAVRAAQVRLQGLLIGGLQRLEQVLRLPAVVAVETPVAPWGRGGGEGGDEKGRHLLAVWQKTPIAGTHFLAMDLASESASWMPFLMVSVKTATCLG